MMLGCWRLHYRLFIQTHKTPNPNFLKFVPGVPVLGSNDPVQIRTIEQASRISPLARKLFRIHGVTQVFYGHNYISVAKEDSLSWTDMKPLIFDIIEGHYESGQALIVDRSKTEEIDIQEGDLEVVKIIKELLAERVRPFVQDDGGDVKFVGFDEGTGVLTVKMMGSCSGCPSSEATLKQGILKMMKYYVGEINDVVKDTEQDKGKCNTTQKDATAMSNNNTTENNTDHR